MRITLYTMYLLFGIIFGVSCTEIADIDPKERILGVYCVLTNDSIQSVELRYSSYISESSYPMVDDATVRVSYHLDTVFVDDKGDVVFLDTVGVYDFNKVAPGKWQAEFVPMENVVYTLEVSVPGEDLVTATTRFPKKVDIPAFNYSEYPMSHFHIGMPSLSWTYGHTDTKSISLPDITDLYNGYGVQIGGIHNGPPINYKVSGPLTLWIYGMDYNPQDREYHIADYIYTDHLHLDKFNISGKTKDDLDFNQSNFDLELLQMWWISGWGWWAEHPEYTRYRQLPLQFWALDSADISLQFVGFDGSDYYNYKVHPTLWPSNDKTFSHRYLRIQHPGTDGYVTKRKVTGNCLIDTSLTLCRPSDYMKYPEFEALLSRGESDYFTICVHFAEWKYLSPHPLSHLVFESVSTEYDKYLKDLVSFELGALQKIDVSDITHLWERVEVYSNITNGKGIFGASHREKVRWGITESYYNAYLQLGDEV